MSLVEVSTIEPGVRLVEMVDRARYNALSAEMVSELVDAFTMLGKERGTRVIVLRGDPAGRGFCAGADLSGTSGPAPDTEGRSQVGLVHRFQEHIANLVLAVHEVRQPVISAVHGAAVGGGLALALASDVRVAAEGAFFAVQFVKVGLSACDVGTSYFLPRIVGAGRAMELMLTGRRFSAEEAERIGLLTRLVPVDGLLDAALDTARAITALSEYSVEFTKLGAWANLDATSLRQAMELENRTQVLGAMTGNMAAATRAFREGGDPEWPPL
jgi:enoyl-CoA hydratase